MQIETKRWPWSAIGDPQHQQVGERKMQTVPDANASKSLNPHHYMWSFFFSNNFLKFFNHKHFKIGCFCFKIYILVEKSKYVLFFSLYSHWTTSVGTSTCFSLRHVLPAVAQMVFFTSCCSQDCYAPFTPSALPTWAFVFDLPFVLFQH